MLRLCLVILAVMATLMPFDDSATASAQGEALVDDIDVRDFHGQSLEGRTILLVDWEGEVANPVYRLSFVAPPGLAFPFTLSLEADSSWLQFDSPSEIGGDGPSKSVSFSGPGTKTVHLSVWPDRNGNDEQHTLAYTVQGQTRTIPIAVRDDDLPGSAAPFTVITDFSEDQTTFFQNPIARQIAQQAADDWAYFLDDPPFDAVAAGAQQTFIWNVNTIGGRFVQNAQPFQAFLVYFYGINHPGIHSFAGASNSGFQSVNGVQWSPGLRRAGGVGAETRGNYSTAGWYFSLDDADWWTHQMYANEVHDFYSIVLHELGHVFGYHEPYPVSEQWQNAGQVIKTAKVNAYHPGPIPFSNVDHVDAVDGASLKGGFGNEFATLMPFARWQITKLHLLLLEAIGWPLRETSAFRGIEVAAQPAFVAAVVGQVANAAGIAGEWGVPPYKFTIASGSLPPGVSIDPVSGALTGTPAAEGMFTYAVRIDDGALAGATSATSAPITLRVFPAGPHISLDTTCDGTISAEDALAVLAAIAGLEDGPLPASPCTGDNDGLPGLSLEDALGILQRLMVAS